MRKFYVTLSIVVSIIVAGSALYYFTFFLPKQFKDKQAVQDIKAQNDYIFSMKQKCEDVANEAYSAEVKKFGDFDDVILRRYTYSQKLNSCLYEISDESKPGNLLNSYSINVVDGLSGQALAGYSRLGDENPPFDDYQKKSDALFNQ